MFIITLYSCLLEKLFPQIGKGMKHQRKIKLEEFQIKNLDDIQFIKGLFHSDGCLYKSTNKKGMCLGHFYNFTNMSKDIIDIYCNSLKNIGVNYKLIQNKKCDRYGVNVYKQGDFIKLYPLIGVKNLNRKEELDEHYNKIINKLNKQKNKTIKIIKQRKEKTEHFCSCGKKIKKSSKMCEKCTQLNSRKIKNRPTLEILLKEINESNYLQVGKKYGVTDNCIRKWIRQYGVEPPKKLKKAR